MFCAATVLANAQSVADPAQLIQVLDTNHDGDKLVTRVEFNEAADRIFARLDSNADGLLTVEDGFEG